MRTSPAASAYNYIISQTDTRKEFTVDIRKLEILYITRATVERENILQIAC